MVCTEKEACRPAGCSAILRNEVSSARRKTVLPARRLATWPVSLSCTGFLWTRHCRIRNREEQRDGQRNRRDGCGCWGCGQRGRATLVHAVHGPGRGGGRSIGARPAAEPFAQARRGAAADAGRAGRRLVSAARPAGL